MEEKRPLKVCFTCGYWTKKYKGYCEKQKLGTGKFWYCKEWTTKALIEEESVDK